MLSILNKNIINNNDLYLIAEEYNAHIDYINAPLSEAIAVSLNGSYYIGMDYSISIYSAEERVRLCHELGHISTNAFYGIEAPYANRMKAERQAQKWAINKLIPKDVFIELLKKNYNKWEIAEYLNITTDIVDKAYNMYFECGVSA